MISSDIGTLTQSLKYSKANEPLKFPQNSGVQRFFYIMNNSKEPLL